MNARVKLLPNGIRFVFRPRPGQKTVDIIIGSVRSSRFERPDLIGVTHFAEHCLFGGTAKRTKQDIKNQMQLMGDFTNACTGTEYVMAMGLYPRADVMDAADMLTDIFYKPSMPDEYVEQERQIILQEIGKYQDSPFEYTLKRAYETHFLDKGLGIDPLGPAANVAAFTRETVLKEWSACCATENCIASVSGDPSIEGEMQALFSSIESRGEKCVVERSESAQGRSILTKKAQDQVYLCMIYDGPSVTSQQGVRTYDVMNDILGGGMNSRLFTNVRERLGAGYQIGSVATNSVLNDYLVMYGVLDPKKWERARDAMLHELHDLAENGPREEEVMMTKRSHLADLSIRYDNVSRQNRGDFYVVMHGRDPEDFETQARGIDAVTARQVQELARQLIASGDPTVHVMGGEDVF